MIGDKNLNNAVAVSDVMCNAGFDAEPIEMDLASRDSILGIIHFCVKNT